MTYYFDNSSTTLIKPPQVAEAVFRSLAEESIGNPSRGSHTQALEALRQVERTRSRVADLFHAKSPTQVSFMPNATYALNTLLQSSISEGDAVVTTMNEHNSVLRPLYQLEAKGVNLSFLPLDGEGAVDVSVLPSLVQPHTKAVVVNHMSNVTGHIADLTAIGDFCLKHGLLFFVDAAQSAGAVWIDIEEMKIDALCFTGHKSLYGPQGTGGICFGSRFLLEHKPQVVFSGGSGSHSFQKKMPADMPGVFEVGTPNVHGLAGLEAGLVYVAEKGVATIQQQLQEQTLFFLTLLASVPRIRVYGTNASQMRAHPERQGGIVSLNLAGWESGELADILSQDYGISVRAGAHCAPLVHRHFDTVETGMVRFSLSTYTTKEDIVYAVEALKEIGQFT